MFVDASALVSILLSETDSSSLEDQLLDARIRLSSPMAVFEATLAVRRQRTRELAVARATVVDYARASRISIVPITAEIGSIALDAHAQYGKGSGHPAKLNMGDCFSYACAKAHAVPLLYKGDDFVHTDLA